jgi:hypothetical protein
MRHFNHFSEYIERLLDSSLIVGGMRHNGAAILRNQFLVFVLVFVGPLFQRELQQLTMEARVGIGDPRLVFLAR